MSKERFHSRLKESFFPRLRAAGFTGSGQNFRRVRGDVIHAINIQGDKYGDGCAVNLGIHLRFLPVTWSDSLPDFSKFKEIDCEFRKRLSPEDGTDNWWKYETVDISPEESADSLAEAYFAYGAPFFENYSSSPAILSVLNAVDFTHDITAFPLGQKTRARAALTAARMYAHAGDRAACRRFATIGLAHLGKVSSLKDELEYLAKEGTSPRTAPV